MVTNSKPASKSAIQHMIDQDDEVKEKQPKRRQSPRLNQSRLRAKEEHKPMTRKDIDNSHFISKDELIQFLKDSLKLEVIGCGFTDPNGRNIRLWLGEELLSDQYIDVTQKPEYEG